MSFKVYLHGACELRGVGPDHGKTIGGPQPGHHLLVWQNGRPNSDDFGFETVVITTTGWEHQPGRDLCNTRVILSILDHKMKFCRGEDIELNIYSEVQRLNILIRNHISDQLSPMERRYAYERYGGHRTYPLASACPYERAA